MRYQFVNHKGKLQSTPNRRLACLAALKCTHGESIPDGATAAVIRVHADGRRFWCVVRAKSNRKLGRLHPINMHYRSPACNPNGTVR